MNDTSVEAQLRKLVEREKAERTRGEVVGFLDELRPGGPWQLHASSGNGLTSREFIDPDECRAWVAEFIGKADIYYTPNPLRDGVDGNKRQPKESLVAVEYCHVDVDPVGDEPQQDVTARVTAALDTFPLKPTFVIETGRGVQMLWRMDPPMTLAEGEGWNRKLTERFSGDKGTWDASRILRLPGCMNMMRGAKKAGRKPALTRRVKL